VVRGVKLASFAALVAAFVFKGGAQNLTLSTDAVAPTRFVAAHGERALLMGYPEGGLEAWAYPFQLFEKYRVQFLLVGTSEAIDGAGILRRIETRPDEIVRVYVGPEFEVREHLFVPLDRAGVAVRYDITGQRAVDLRVTLLPVLNLMWPAAIGGQDLGWREPLSAYEICEATTGYCADIGSPQQTAHSEVVNSTLRQDLTQSMELHPVDGHVAVYAALGKGRQAADEELRSLEQNADALRAAAEAHAQAVQASGLQIVTPDERLNAAIRWSRIALDQAWVCNTQLGCGMVAGYGPSRGSRRPQYAWFFAGDGLVATEALLAEGNAAGAKEELNFILKYQNAASGMMWHELSQSAGFIDWAGKYPYMYVHVDITFDFLSTLADYARTTGDTEFLREHWSAIASAFAYCRALIDPATALPSIPAGKEGANEQERMREDVGLSAAWVSAAEGYRQMAVATGHEAEATAAEHDAAAARKAFTARYWDAAKGFWIAGYAESGQAMTDERSHAGLLGQGLFTPEQEGTALARLASAGFETDWGTRGMSAASAHFDPNSYGSGSISALGTAEMAKAFWRDHEPAIAWPIFKSLLPWFHLDSLGHLHEVAAGDAYHPQVESVPEQTWSAAGFLSATVHGLLGLDIDGAGHRLSVAPHPDPRWDRVTVSQIGVGQARMAIAFEPKPGAVEANFTASGGAVHVSFAPEIPLGAIDVRAVVDRRNVPVTVASHKEDEHARVEFDVGEAPVDCRIAYRGGVRVVAPDPDPIVGGRSVQLKLAGVAFEGNRLTLDADVFDGEHASVEIETPWSVGTVEGGAAVPLSDGGYRLTFARASGKPETSKPDSGAPFVHEHMVVELH
jgi:glycogen debranching enzyme